MKTELQYPYNTIWNNGYLVTNKENRKTVILYNNRDNRSSVSYARYLMACKLKRFLNDNEHVDHINDDKTDDSLSNLQILTPLENRSKQARNGRVTKDFVCPVCGKSFSLTARRYANKSNPTCSRKCGGIKSHWR